MSEGYYDQMDVPTPGAADIEIETADLFEALRVKRRRFVILMVDRFGQMDTGELADRITRHEVGDHFNTQDRKAVYVGLYQTHLGTLDDANLVEYNKPRGTAKPSPLTGEAAAYIRDGYDRFACHEGAREVLE